MKIAVVTQNFPVREQPYRGHSAYQTLLRLNELAELEIFAPQLLYPSFLLPKHRAWARTDLTHRDPVLNATFFSYPALPIVSRPFNGSVCAHYLEPFLRVSKPDVIVSYWIYPDGYAAVEVGRKLGIPVIVKAIGSDVNRAAGISRRLTMNTLLRAHKILSVSQDLADKMIAMGVPAEKIIISRNGCDTHNFRFRDPDPVRRVLGLAPHRRYIAYVGRYDLWKGLRELITAFARVRASFSGAELLLIGEGSARQELHALAEKLGISEFVHFVGPFRTQEIAKWVAACDVLALPSYAEGCPNVVIEALCSGRPVVGTRVGGIPELLDDGGHSGVLVPARDAHALADGLCAALSRPWDNKAIAARHQRSWATVAQEMLHICEQVAGHTAPQPHLVEAN